MSLSNSIFRSRDTLTEGNSYIATIKEEYWMSLSNSTFSKCTIIVPYLCENHSEESFIKLKKCDYFYTRILFCTYSGGDSTVYTVLSQAYIRVQSIRQPRTGKAYTHV